MDSSGTGDNWVGRTVRRVADSRRVRRPSPLESAVQVVVWWEVRRPLYNLVVGGTGLAVCGAYVLCVSIIGHLTGEAGDFGLPDPPLFGILLITLYGILANVCYTGGWLAELAVRSARGLEAGRFGEITFTLGLLFSVALTCLPALVVLPMAVLHVSTR